MKHALWVSMLVMVLHSCIATSQSLPSTTPFQLTTSVTHAPKPSNTSSPPPTLTYTPTFTKTSTATTTPTRTETATFTPVPTSSILYFEDFEDGNANNWFDYFGTWTIETEGENHYWIGSGPKNYPHVWISLNTSNWFDYAFESRVRFKKGGLFICVRWGKSTGFYNAFLNPSGNWVEFAEFDNKNYVTFGGKNFTIPRNEWLIIRFEVEGTNLRLFINNRLAASAIRNSHDKGGVGYYMGGGEEIHFDDIRVWQLISP